MVWRWILNIDVRRNRGLSQFRYVQSQKAFVQKVTLSHFHSLTEWRIYSSWAYMPRSHVDLQYIGLLSRYYHGMRTYFGLLSSELEEQDGDGSPSCAKMLCDS